MTSLGLALCLLLTLGILTSAELQTKRSGGGGGEGKYISCDLCRSKKRDPRFFFISTKTAYVSTSTQCFVTGSALSACAARKRRILDGGENISLLQLSSHLTSLMFQWRNKQT